MWDRSAIRFELVHELSDGDVVTIIATTPVGELAFMGEVRLEGQSLVARRVHAGGYGMSVRPGAVGVANLVVIAHAFLEKFEYDELIIEGAKRTTGLRKGHRPRQIRFTRPHDEPRGA